MRMNVREKFDINIEWENVLMHTNLFDCCAQFDILNWKFFDMMCFAVDDFCCRVVFFFLSLVDYVRMEATRSKYNGGAIINRIKHSNAVFIRCGKKYIQFGNSRIGLDIFFLFLSYCLLF